MDWRDNKAALRHFDKPGHNKYGTYMKKDIVQAVQCYAIYLDQP